MKVCFGMLFKNDADILKDTIVKIPNIFHRYVFLDTGSKDESRNIILKTFPDAIIIEDTIDHIDFGRWRNLIIKAGEEEGCDWMFMLDSDETMFLDDYNTLFSYAESGDDSAYRLSRIEFALDRLHYRNEVYPDLQSRLFKLGCGYYYYPQVHAVLHNNTQAIHGQSIPNCPIFHYGWTRNLDKKLLHYHNAGRTQRGLPMDDELPKELSTIPDWFSNLKVFFGDQP